MELAKNQEHTVTIEGYGEGGMGVARIDGRVVFVHGALRGEKCRVLILKTLKSVAFAKVLEVLEPSSERITPDCPDNQGGYALSKIRNASGRAMLFDIYRSGSSPNGSRAPYSPAAQNRAEMVDNGKNGTWRHKGGSGGNICFVDGHVEGRSFDEIPYNRLNSQSDNRGDFWCNVN